MENKETLRMVLTLVVICVVSAAALSLVYRATYPKIQERAIGELKSTLERVLPEATAFDEPAIPEDILSQREGIKRVFVGLDKDRTPVGTAVIIEGAGYQDYIQLFVTVSPDLKGIKSIEVLEQKETPGLGARIEEKEFLDQFKGDLKEEYDAITGATVSSSTVIDLVNKAVDDLYRIIEPVEGEPKVIEEEGIVLEEELEEIDAETEASPEWNGTITPGWNETEENESIV
ncbi:FMN-binding protein [Candidatus Woesearchaeota archaeon]|nr:FMN-binding protein [Candidatus Woesearchaeota archaeon]